MGKIINFDVLKKYVSDSPDVQKLILGKYAKSAQDILQDILAAHKNNDFISIENNAHKLKSSSKAVGAISLADLAINLETAAKDNNKAAVHKLVPELKILVDQVIIEINRLF